MSASHQGQESRTAANAVGPIESGSRLMRLNHILRCTASVAVVGIAAFGLVGGAAAQDGPTTVDDIIVTAQKREQSLETRS